MFKKKEKDRRFICEVSHRFAFYKLLYSFSLDSSSCTSNPHLSRLNKVVADGQANGGVVTNEWRSVPPVTSQSVDLGAGGLEQKFSKSGKKCSKSSLCFEQDNLKKR